MSSKKGETGELELAALLFSVFHTHIDTALKAYKGKGKMKNAFYTWQSISFCVNIYVYRFFTPSNSEIDIQMRTLRHQGTHIITGKTNKRACLLRHL